MAAISKKKELKNELIFEGREGGRIIKMIRNEFDRKIWFQSKNQKIKKVLFHHAHERLM